MSDLAIDESMARLKARATKLGSDEPKKSVTVTGSELLYLHGLITSLREALEPFAAITPHYEGVKNDYLVVRHVGESGDHPLVVADFRRAREALREQS